MVGDRLRVPLAISLGAIAGSLLRYYLTLGLSQWLGNSFPFGTFVANLTGAFGLGFFATWIILDRVSLPPDIQLTITVGFFGAYTTFSSYELDAETLIVNRSESIALLYWVCTALLGVLCLEGGRSLARKLW